MKLWPIRRRTEKQAQRPRTRSRTSRPEGAGWVTPEGYQFASVLSMLQPPEARPEALEVLVQGLIDHHVRVGRRAIAVCSPAVGAGVSVTSANIAIGLAQAGVSTLLVDANLDSPGQHLLIAPRTVGLSLECVLSGEPIHQAIHHEVLPHFSVLYAAGDANSSGDRIATEAFEHCAQAFMRDFECTIFDTPPANRSPSARAISAVARYAVLVVRRDGSFADDVVLLTEQLEQDGVMILGSVLNG
jgi:protein-tyrosine kinase